MTSPYLLLPLRDEETARKEILQRRLDEFARKMEKGK